MKQRHLARRMALQVLFEVDLAHHMPGVVLTERLADQDEVLTDEVLTAEATEFAQRLVHGVIVYQAKLDAVIAQHAPEWPVSQIAAIDRNILRMALWEIGVDGTPVKVAINEAVELAKVFGAEASPRFVNGVLGAATRDDFDIRQALAQPARAHE